MAIVFDQLTRNRLRNAACEIAAVEPLKPYAERGLHLTLRFIGNEADEVKAMAQLSQLKAEQFDVVFEAVRSFPQKGLTYAYVENGELRSLHSQVLRLLEVNPWGRWVAHVTIASGLIEGSRPINIAARVTEVLLLQNVMKDGKWGNEVVMRFPLAGERVDICANAIDNDPHGQRDGENGSGGAFEVRGEEERLTANSRSGAGVAEDQDGNGRVRPSLSERCGRDG